MKKKVYGRKLSRGFNARKALFRALIRAIVMHGSIETTKAKAKAVQGDIDKLVTLAKAGGINQRRRVYARLGNDRETTDKLFEFAASYFSSRSSGFTKIVKLPRRRGDLAEVVRFEWTDTVYAKEQIKKKKKITKPVEQSKKKKPLRRLKDRRTKKKEDIKK